MVSKHRQLCWFFVICMVPFQFLQAQTQFISLKDALETRGTVIFFVTLWHRGSVTRPIFRSMIAPPNETSTSVAVSNRSRSVTFSNL